VPFGCAGKCSLAEPQVLTNPERDKSSDVTTFSFSLHFTSFKIRHEDQEWSSASSLTDTRNRS